MEAAQNEQLASVDDAPDSAMRLARQRFMLRNYRALALVPFGITLFFVPRDSTNQLWLMPVYISLGWAGFIAFYCLFATFGVLGVRCPRCGERFGTRDECRRCGLPQHRELGTTDATFP